MTDIKNRFQGGFAHFLIVIVVVVVVGIIGVYFYLENGINISILKPQPSQESVCCLGCHNLTNPENKTPGEGEGEEKSCLKSKDLSDKCKELLQKNPDREKECSNNKLEVLNIPTPTPSAGGGNQDNGGLGGMLSKLTGQKCDHENVWWRDLEEIEKKFKGKKWSGTLTGDNYCSDGTGYDYTVKVTDLHIVFDSDLDTFIKTTTNFKKAGIWTPCSAEFLYGGLGLNVEGNATIEYSTFNKADKGAAVGGLCSYTCTVTNDPIPLHLTGKLLFADEGLSVGVGFENIGFDSKKVLKTCGQDDSNCDLDKIIAASDVNLEGSCIGTYCDGSRWSCKMNSNDDCGHNWQVTEMVVEGDVNENGGREVAFVNDRDLKFNTHTGSCSVGDSDKEHTLIGTLNLSN